MPGIRQDQVSHTTSSPDAVRDGNLEVAQILVS